MSHEIRLFCYLGGRGIIRRVLIRGRQEESEPGEKAMGQMSQRWEGCVLKTKEGAPSPGMKGGP